MKVKKKEKEFLACEYARRFTNHWDYFLTASNSFMSGWDAAIKFVTGKLSEHGCPDDVATAAWINSMVQYQDRNCELNDGDHQLSPQTFAKWKAHYGKE